MSDVAGSIERELIRHRIEKRMAGRRDLLLHLVIYLALALFYLLNTPPQPPQQNVLLGGLWTIPLVLHGLLYYYRCGSGAIARADEIESAIESAAEATALDEDEEFLIEERASKRIAARRILAAHFATSSILVALLFALIWLNPDKFNNNVDRLIASSFMALAFALHFVRFFLVHGRTPAGRALKIEAEMERLWHEFRQRGRERREFRAMEDDTAAYDLGEAQGRRLRLTAEGEFDEEIDARSARAVGAN